MPQGPGATSSAARSAAKREARAALDLLERSRASSVKAALYDPPPGGGPRDVLRELHAFARFERAGVRATITQESCEAPGWDAALEGWMFDLTKANMQALYLAAPDWGWSDRKKRSELFTPDMRFFVARDTDTGERLGFVAWTCLLEEDYDTCYVFELHLEARVQRKGLGRHLMLMVELAARKIGMQWCVCVCERACGACLRVARACVGEGAGSPLQPLPPLPAHCTRRPAHHRVFLTVLKSNRSAYEFYMSRLKYNLSDLTPSRSGIEASHDILCKCVDAKGWTARSAVLETLEVPH